MMIVSNRRTRTDMEINGKSNGHDYNIDLLRIIACFSVVVLHCASQFWYSLPVSESEWAITDTYDALFRFGVPVFIAISGVLFLNPQKDISIKKLFTHSILRIWVLFFVWSFLYGLRDWTRFEPSGKTLLNLIDETIGSYHHLWFLPMIAGLYLIVPIIRKWLSIASKKDVEYFLILFIVFKVFVETAQAMVHWRLVNFLIKFVDATMITSYLGYFVLGYYVFYYGIEKKWHKCIYAFGLIGECANVLFSIILSRHSNTPRAGIFDSYSIFTFMVVLALLVFFFDKSKERNNSIKCKKMISEVSNATLGIYLTHVMIIETLDVLKINAMSFPIALGVPILSILVFIIGFCISSLLRRIPFIGRYIC